MLYQRVGESRGANPYVKGSKEFTEQESKYTVCEAPQLCGVVAERDSVEVGCGPNEFISGVTYAAVGCRGGHALDHTCSAEEQTAGNTKFAVCTLHDKATAQREC